MTQIIAQRLILRDEDVTDAAIKMAVAKGWIENRDGHSIRLTDEGRRLA
ncbi:MAG: hypothetical protein PS018_15010 [bacterium]|nr:hypothetical protein [bacterium]